MAAKTKGMLSGIGGALGGVGNNISNIAQLTLTRRKDSKEQGPTSSTEMQPESTAASSKDGATVAAPEQVTTLNEAAMSICSMLSNR